MIDTSSGEDNVRLERDDDIREERDAIFKDTSNRKRRRVYQLVGSLMGDAQAARFDPDTQAERF